MMNNSLSSLIETAESVLIILPKSPRFDQVAAGLSLFLSISDRKETAIYCPSPMLVEFNRLVGVNKVTTELGNKNLVVKFVGYPAKDIERVSYDIEKGEFRLTVIPKPGLVSPKKGQVQLFYSGVVADTVILVSGKIPEHFPALPTKDLARSKLAHIGTRAISLPTGQEIISFAQPASSVSEVVATLIKESGLAIDTDIATNLIMGIEEGSKKFTSAEVTAGTFEMMAYLLKAGGRRLPENVRPKRILTPTRIARKSTEEKGTRGPPKSWLEPKIYKGTTIS